MDEFSISWFGLGAVLAILNAAIIIGTSIRSVGSAIKGNAEPTEGAVVSLLQYLMVGWLAATIVRHFLIVIALWFTP